ncbi:DNA-directed RNA polymerase subunit beta [Hippea maritima]|uniref:DNA-directed RNA polymerase subunit beta n=1 Tax=Hippea maritima (strain ATCC 700847 / DSM 10411 / MH2) TaxID=760142 RepID=F2LXU9_HIPMA|nr:DNA-directed RNA polymerase subunit beta [Hippea maritima]AEA34340.1 DNA-directed RNA polymerase subunit beta [Hippea maritima DSM 10411]
MAEPLKLEYRMRVNFSKAKKVLEIPDLLRLNINSYQTFLEKNSKKEKNLDNALKSIFPIDDVHGRLRLELVDWDITPPKFDPDECKVKGISYTGNLIIKVRLTQWTVDEQTGEKIGVEDIKEQEIYVGEIPLITESGSFIINGVERVIVGQLHRSPGVIFKKTGDIGGKGLYYAQIIPERGSWVEFETEPREVLSTRIDRKKKFPATILLQAMGMSEADILREFYEVVRVKIENGQIFAQLSESIIGFKVDKDVEIDGEVVIKEGRKLTTRLFRQLKDVGVEYVPIRESELYNKYSAEIVEAEDEEGVDVVLGIGTKITKEKLGFLKKFDKEFNVLYSKFDDYLILNTVIASREVLRKRKVALPDSIAIDDLARVFIHTLLRPGEHTSIEDAKKFFENLFFNPERYDVSQEGRIRLNETFNINVPEDVRTLTREDFVGLIKHVVLLENDQVIPDDVDSLSNRKVNLVGDQLYREIRNGLLRMQRLIKDKMVMSDAENIMPYDVINAKPVAVAIKDFFSTGQLSQFLDQTNILSEISHKRRLSALGSGGLTRERAGFEVRDVHPTHYGRICPIETPEGANIGLISSLAVYAKINEFGFIETPYRIVKDGRVTDEVVYLSASKEKGHIIAQASAPLNEDGTFKNEYVSARKDGEFVVVKREDVDLMDISTNQIVSVAAGLIPFLEHDDANRALMGSNMQRQAVPLIRPEAPLVGTGLEPVVAKYSRYAVVAKRDGKVVRIDDKIYISCKTENGYELDVYPLKKFIRSNQDTCFSHNPIVDVGDEVKTGQIIADGPSMDKGELALGKNLVVAFVSWRGYNYEDGITISRRVVEEDLYTSIHIKEFTLYVRDTKFGMEEITADIPNASSETLRNLDKNGIVRIGAYVKPNDVLVGKVTPKAETHYSPEEKLLRSIFGEKATNVADTSLRVPPDTSGIVVDVRIMHRRGAKINPREKEIIEQQKEKINKELKHKLELLSKLRLDSIKDAIIESDIKTKEELEGLSEKELVPLLPKDFDIKALNRHYKEMEKSIKDYHTKLIKGVEKESDLPPGVISVVNVYVATKRKLSVGDKMSGRHGNKGVVSKILPVQDLPFLEDGTPVDIVLNPLGVPSRMNIGQIMETHLGWLSKGLGKKIDHLLKAGRKDILKDFLKKIYNSEKAGELIESLSDEEVEKYAKEWVRGVHFANPVFEGAKEKDLEYLEGLLGFKRLKSEVYDGITGEKFLEPVTVGVMYVLKLHHLVDDKVHARSVGPYSLVTQQPLGGKANFGGQRFGEMEVWALEGYGAAYTLHEMLTVKSDDVDGRKLTYEAIVKGRPIPLGGVPESFNVLVKEMQALCLDVELLKDIRRK